MSSGLLPLCRTGFRRLRLAAFLLTLASVAAPAKPAAAPVPPALPPPDMPRYFFTVDLDPRYQIVGSGALTEEEAARANCYDFTYDPSGAVTRIEYRRAGAPAADPLFQAERIDFERQNGIERRWYRTAAGQPMTSVDGIAGEELALNPAGYPVSVTNLDADGKPVRDGNWVIRYVRTLDADNRLVAAHRTGLLGISITDSNGCFDTRTVYDDQGRRMEYGNYDASGNPLNNSDGVALTRTTYTLYPESIQVTESYFDASGLAVAAKSSGVHQRQRTFDYRGFLIGEAYFDVTGAPTLDNDRQVHELRDVYDERGNLLSESFFDTNGKPRNQKQKDFAYARVTYGYDAQNRISTTSYFGDDGAPEVLDNLGAAVVRQEYDAQGHIVRQQFFDGLGNPSTHKRYGVPAIRISVEGDNTVISLRDAHDKLTQNPTSGYAYFTYKTASDHPLSHHNHFYDRKGRPMSKLRVFIINPHLRLLKAFPVMQLSARLGAAGAGLGALLAMGITLRKASFTRRRRVYVPTPLERFIGWFGVFAIGEGMIRFFITIWWAYVRYHNGQMGPGVYLLEGAYIAFFLYRLLRMRVTMRVLNISRADIHGLIREFFSRAHLEPKWIEERHKFTTENLDLSLRYFAQKCHAYLAFRARHRAGADLARGLAQYIRSQVGTVHSSPRTRAIALYYPSVAVCYALLAFTAFYTLWQLVKPS